MILAWSTTEYPEDSVSPFEQAVMRAVHPVLTQIRNDIRFTASIIPEEEDNGGYIRITGLQGPGEKKTVGR